MKAIYLDALGNEDQRHEGGSDVKASSSMAASATNVQSVSPIRSPHRQLSKENSSTHLKDQRNSVVADMQLTKDHIGLVAKYFDNPDDALHILTRSTDLGSSQSPHQAVHTASPTFSRTSDDVGRKSPIQLARSARYDPAPLVIDHSENSLSSPHYVKTPKTGDSRGIDALLDWAKDLGDQDDFLKDF